MDTLAEAPRILSDLEQSHSATSEPGTCQPQACRGLSTLLVSIAPTDPAPHNLSSFLLTLRPVTDIFIIVISSNQIILRVGQGLYLFVHCHRL